jgi:hypothetical protein
LNTYQYPQALGTRLFALFLVACGGTAGSQESAANPSLSASSAAPRPAAQVQALRSAPAPVKSADAPPSTLMPALSVHFEVVPLPKGTTGIRDIAGRADNDAWFLTASGAVLQWDGRAVTERGAPVCYTDACCGSLTSSKGGQPVPFESLEVTAKDVTASALIFTGGLRPSLVTARLGAGGRWVCEQGSGDFIYPGAVGRGDTEHATEITIGGSQIRFEGPARLVNPLGGSTLVIDGRKVPLPDAGSFSPLALTARAADDLWLWSRYGGVWRGNGLLWQALPIELESLDNLWLDGDLVWAFGSDKTGTYVAHRDGGGGPWQRMPVPGAKQIVENGSHTFWALGSSGFYRWDGETLGRAEAPLDFGAAWQSPSGTLWVGGRAQAPTKRDDPGVGALVRRVGNEAGR